ncbi:MAG: hypothetical protein KF763_13050 [Cyclobacteriaceae bacterium]|nr:hypothetical protein [Cyclobacteriaceae bacterium]
MSLSKVPNWVRVLEHFERNHYITNGLTIPFLIGCRPHIYPNQHVVDIEEFLSELMLSSRKTSLMTCGNNGQIVVGLLDLESSKVVDQCGYRSFGNIYFIDDTFKSATCIEDVISDCKSRYSDLISAERYSFENGKWSRFSEIDMNRFSEVSQPAILEFMNPKDVNINTRLEEIFKEYESGQLDKIVPLWHTDIVDIDLRCQRHNLPAAKLRHGIEIIQNVDIELLFDNMFSSEAEYYREKKLFRDDSDWSISRVMDHWIKGEKLIPPTITFESHVTSRNLYPADGKHRINVAYFYGACQIPILILKSQRQQILDLLGI